MCSHLINEKRKNNIEANQWPAPGLGTDLRRTRSVLMRWRAMSFSSTSVACPFLLGVEDGTVPLGRELKNKLSLEEGSIFFPSFSPPRRSFLPSKHEHMEAKRTKERTSKVAKRAMAITATNEKEREQMGYAVFGSLCWE